jgi:hypothetical protein
MAAKVELSKTVQKLADAVPLDKAALADTVGRILAKGDELHYDLGGPIVAGLDVNGPIVACDDNNFVPFKGAMECIRHLMDTPGVEVTLMTGWDLSTMDFFRKNKLKLPVGIVGEYGMVYERQGQTRHLYPYREEERLGFMSAVLTAAAEGGIKVAFQGNYSPGSGALCIEADEFGELLKHPLVNGRRPTMGQLFDALKTKSKAQLQGDRIIFDPQPGNLQGVAEALFKTHPLISVRAAKEHDGLISIRIDPKDRPDFANLQPIRNLAADLEKRTGRSSIVYEDHGLDLVSKEAQDGGYSKDAGLREYGREAFGHDRFISAIIGDKGTDIPKTTRNTLFFPLTGSDAEPLAAEGRIPSVSLADARDFALALAEAHRLRAKV